jgi:CHASE2 domain-containing sensor protein
VTLDRRQHSWLAEFVIEALLLFVLGGFVAFVMFFFHELELYKAIDRTVIDLLMRAHAWDQLVAKTPDPTTKHLPRFVFVDISEEACREWARERHTSCTLSMITPRKELTKIANEISKAIGGGNGPKLVVFDIEFAPLPVSESRKPELADDKDLSSRVIELADKVAVIALRPMSVDPNTPSSRNIGFYSIFDHAIAKKDSCEPNGGSQTNGLWFASSLIDADPDGVVRTVHAWDEILNEKTNQPGFIPGVGFLGAALLDSQFRCEAIRFCFNASNSLESAAPRPDCEKGVAIGDRTYHPRADPQKTSRILFSLPYQAEGAAGSTDYPPAPSQIETIEALKLDKRLKETPALLKDAVVVVGGSYWLSGDLRPVPLNARMPGAMVHANAIRAYATGKIVDERLFDLRVKLVFIAVAAFVGAASHLLAARVTVAARPWSAFFTGLGITTAGLAFSFFLVVVIGREWAFGELLMRGKAIGALTPAVAVALEGFCGILGQVRDQFRGPIARAYSWLRERDQ